MRHRLQPRGGATNPDYLDEDFMADKVLKCDMTIDCDQPVTHVDQKGYVYCTTHGIQRRGYQPCRTMRPFEITRLTSGQPLTKY